MAQDLTDWMPTLATTLATLSGLDGGVRYYADMPGVLLEFPIGLLTTVDGVVGPGASVGTIDVTQLQFTIFATQQFIPECHSLLIPFVARVRNLLAANTTLGGLVQRVGPSSEDKFWSGPGRVAYTHAAGNEQEYGAIIFRLEVKHQTAITVSA
jgi:hypothetical protein